MEYSDIITLTENGFNLQEKQILPIGIFDGSRCWGAPVTNVGYEIGAREKRPSNHIILSPIPFNSWACTIRIQARVNDQPRMIYYLLDALNEACDKLHTNIISISDNTSGYYNGRVNLLVELVDFRGRAEKIQELSIKKKEKRINMTKYSVDLLKRMSDIKKCIEEANQKREKKFLYYPDADTGGNYLWKEMYFLRDKIGIVVDKIKKASSADEVKDIVAVYDELYNKKNEEGENIGKHNELLVEFIDMLLEYKWCYVNNKSQEEKKDVGYADILNGIEDVIGQQKEFKSYGINVLSCMWLRTQAMAYLYSEVEQPFRFDYVLKENIMKSEIHGESSSLRIAHHFDLDLPAMYLATFHSTNKYIRLAYLQNDNCHERLVKIGYKYSCSFNSTKNRNNVIGCRRNEGDRGVGADTISVENGVRNVKCSRDVCGYCVDDISGNGSNGLLHYLTGGLSAGDGECAKIKINTDAEIHECFNVDIKNIISFSKRESRRYESGSIEILGYCKGVINKSLDEISSEITSRIGNFGKICKREKGEYQFKSTVDVSFVSPYKIFLSCREEIKKDNTFNRIFKSVSKKYGVTIELSDESAETVTSDVVNRLSSVDALIIVFSITDTEHQEYMQAMDKSKYIPNLGWLLFELGIGMGKKIPTVQFRDTTVVTKEHWSHWINVGKDSALFFIDRKRPDYVEIELEKAIRSILSKLSVKKFD
ncbi:hypothetical protein EST62_07165 [Chlorobaculum sp. 24CR]|uniref:hypothetical protein n=1 Tax=Chlorobaculum sp. 24CR TaxID=2508878 RepID=UPI00100C19B5|nr:hypothetical protein [Chlorobaculum sp. 24CR]RXK85217.1 hypothetical protein EST62_07165 [Chlorobaculum sp. 24CR]